MVKNKWLLLGLSILSFFGLNGLVNKHVKASNINNTVTEQSNYQQKINQLEQVPKVQENANLKIIPAHSTQTNRNFKNNISNQANKLQNHIVNHGIKINQNKTKNERNNQINNNSKYQYNAIHAYKRDNQSNQPKHFEVNGAKNLKFQGQGTTDACEMASVKNVLSVNHKAAHTSLTTMINRVGWNKNWNYGYTGNPYTKRGVTISPWLEAKVLKYYGVKAHVHNYMSKDEMISDLKRGMQFIIEAGHRCYSYHANHTVSDHILAITGIKRNRHGLYVQYVEPNTNVHPIEWCPFDRLWKSYNRPSITGDRLVVAGY